jgi:hypothetical protein
LQTEMIKLNSSDSNFQFQFSIKEISRDWKKFTTNPKKLLFSTSKNIVSHQFSYFPSTRIFFQLPRITIKFMINKISMDHDCVLEKSKHHLGIPTFSERSLMQN